MLPPLIVNVFPRCSQWQRIAWGLLGKIVTTYRDLILPLHFHHLQRKLRPLPHLDQREVLPKTLSGSGDGQWASTRSRPCCKASRRWLAPAQTGQTNLAAHIPGALGNLSTQSSVGSKGHWVLPFAAAMHGFQPWIMHTTQGAQGRDVFSHSYVVPLRISPRSIWH